MRSLTLSFALVCVIVVLVAGAGGEGAGSVDDSSIVPEQAPLGEEIVKPPVDATPVQRSGEVGGGAEEGSRPAAGDSGETEQEDEELMRRLEAFRAKKKAKQASKAKKEPVPQTASQETGATGEGEGGGGGGGEGGGGGGEIAGHGTKKDSRDDRGQEGGGGEAEVKRGQEAETRMEGDETKNDKPVKDGGKDRGGGEIIEGEGEGKGKGEGRRKNAKGSGSKSSRMGKLGGDVGAVEGIEDFEEELDTFEAAERAVNEKKRLEAAKVNKHTCTHMHTHTHIHIHIYIHTYTHTQIHTYMHIHASISHSSMVCIEGFWVTGIRTARGCSCTKAGKGAGRGSKGRGCQGFQRAGYGPPHGLKDGAGAKEGQPVPAGVSALPYGGGWGARENGQGDN